MAGPVMSPNFDDYEATPSMLDAYRAKLGQLKLRDLQVEANNNPALKAIYDEMTPIETKFNDDVALIEKQGSVSPKKMIGAAVVVAIVVMVAIVTAALITLPITLGLIVAAFIVSMAVTAFVFTPMVWIMEKVHDNKMKKMAEDRGLDSALDNLSALKKKFDGEKSRQNSAKDVNANASDVVPDSDPKEKIHRAASLPKMNGIALFAGETEVSNQNKVAVSGQRQRANSLR